MSYRWVMIGSAIGGLLRCTITRWTLAIGLWGNALLNARAAVVTQQTPASDWLFSATGPLWMRCEQSLMASVYRLQSGW